MMRALYLFLDSEILIDLISLSLATSFSLNSHHGIATQCTHQNLGDDDEPKKNHTQVYRYRYPCKILYPYCMHRSCQALNC